MRHGLLRGPATPEGPLSAALRRPSRRRTGRSGPQTALAASAGAGDRRVPALPAAATTPPHARDRGPARRRIRRRRRSARRPSAEHPTRLGSAVRGAAGAGPGVRTSSPSRRRRRRRAVPPAGTAAARGAYGAVGCRAPMSGAESCPASSRCVSSSPKSGAWKGFVAGDGGAAAAQLCCPSGAENSDVSSMGGFPSVDQVPEGAWCAVTRHGGPTASSSWRRGSGSASASSRSPRVPRGRRRDRPPGRDRTRRV